MANELEIQEDKRKDRSFLIVGSKKALDNDEEILAVEVAEELAKRNWICRAGGDTVGIEKVFIATYTKVNFKNLKIYLPYQCYNNFPIGAPEVVLDFPTEDSTQLASNLWSQEYHAVDRTQSPMPLPSNRALRWPYNKYYPSQLKYARDLNLIFDEKLNNPINFAVIYANINSSGAILSNIKHIVNFIESIGIPVFNLADNKNKNIFMEYFLPNC